ncbi:hypothetical protein [Ferrovibrio sp.]|uniref:hypothetical protein n=1 Tax=Ferrovibrio sp. TaxID=1917215 RepID=UPI0035117144
MTPQETPKDGELLRSYQRYLARAVGGSALRNQGAPDMVKTARGYLETVDLKALADCNQDQYMAVLDQMTDELANRFPDGGQGNWGAARKATNIFLFACCRELVFSRAYGLDRLKTYLEMPLDSYAIKYLRNKARSANEKTALDDWTAIRTLTKPLSDRIQEFAAAVARREGCFRCELDLIAWTERNADKGNNLKGSS